MTEALFDSHHTDIASLDQITPSVGPVDCEQQRYLGNSIAEFLQAMQELSGSSLNEMAEPFGVSKSSMCNWMSGLRVPSKENLEKIRLKFNLSNAEAATFARDKDVSTKARERIKAIRDASRITLQIGYEIGTDISWMEKANCREVPKSTMYPKTITQTRIARAVCAGCPVEVECLEHAMGNNIPDGVWSGLTWPERRELAEIWQSEEAGGF